MPTATLTGAHAVAAGDPLAYTETAISRIADAWDLRPVVGYADAPAAVDEQVTYTAAGASAIPLPVPAGAEVTRGSWVRAVGAGYGDIGMAGWGLACVFGVAAETVTGPGTAQIHPLPGVAGLDI